MDKTKEEILAKNINDIDPSQLKFLEPELESILISMDQYADQQSKEVSISFAEYIADNDYEWDAVENAWVGTTENTMNLILTHDQLFTLFLTQNKD